MFSVAVTFCHCTYFSVWGTTAETSKLVLNAPYLSLGEHQNVFFLLFLFNRYIRVPKGPTSCCDLLWESSILYVIFVWRKNANICFYLFIFSLYLSLYKAGVSDGEFASKVSSFFPLSCFWNPMLQTNYWHCSFLVISLGLCVQASLTHLLWSLWQHTMHTYANCWCLCAVWNRNSKLQARWRMYILSMFIL